MSIKIAFIGLGDVGSRFSSGLKRAGKAEVIGYDLRKGKEEFRDKEERCREYGVTIVNDPEEAVKGCDIIIAATSCSRALKTVKMFAPYLTAGQIYVDLNSAVPEIKEEIAEIVYETGAQFADGGIMETPMTAWEKSQVVLSGKPAEELSKTLNECGMNTRFISTEVGRASSLKILRSIFTKGIEALLIEAYSSAYHYGVLDEVKSSIRHILTKQDPETMFARMLRTDVVHAKRRADEVGDVAKMLHNINMDSTMSEAAYRKLMWSAGSGIKEHFGGAIPEEVMPVVDYFSKLRVGEEA